MAGAKNPEKWTLITCLHCQKQLEVLKSSLPRKRYCSKSCKNAWEHANGIRVVGFDPHKSTFELWVEKHGYEIAVQKDADYRKTMSKAILSADMSHQKEVARTNRIARNKANTGKTLEEIYGPERAHKTRMKLSLSRRGEKNPAYGKVYQNAGRSVKGHYQGRFFRSLFEYSFMKHLESEGVHLDEVTHESFTIPYCFDNHTRSYIIDFYVPSRATVYEVKPQYVLDKTPDRDKAKWLAAHNYLQNLNIEFKVVTENDFRKISFDEAIKDPDVVWKTQSFSYFRRTK